jgi:uncharacterized peroxidase-related enzyme
MARSTSARPGTCELHEEYWAGVCPGNHMARTWPLTDQAQPQKEGCIMSRIAIPPSRDDAPAAAQPTLDAIGRQLGFVPNLHRLLSISPNALAGFVALQNSLSWTLEAKTRHGIALAVSEVNDCDYCRSAHSYAASTFCHMPPNEIALCAHGRSGNDKRHAAVSFATKVTQTRGNVNDADLAAVREAGYTDPQIIEIVSLSAQFLLTNLINNVAQTDIDFPAPQTAEIG